MVRISFIEHDGTRRDVSAPAGMSVMEVATYGKIPGIIGDCGGMCGCGTCHVYVDAAFADRLPLPDRLEQHLLDFVPERRSTSRLGCQIALSDALDGIIVETPVQQY